MGYSSDNNAVVTPDLRVRNVRGLRVIDSSVIPVLPGGQTGAPTVMVAEAAAAMMTAEQAAGKTSAGGSAVMA